MNFNRFACRYQTTAFLLSGMLFLSCNVAWIYPLSERVEKGNELYAREEFAQAQKQYEAGRALQPESPQLYFNLADTFYKQGQYDQAENLYQKAASDGDMQLKSRALHNLGNVKVKKQELDKALDFYRSALRINPEDEDARLNYEHTLNMLQQQQENQQQQQDQQDQEQNKEQKDSDNSDQQDKNEKQQDDSKDQQQSDDNAEQQQQAQNQQQSSGQKQPLTSEQMQELQEKLKPDEKIDANPYLRALEKQEVEQRQQKVYGDSKLYVEKDW